VECRKQQARLRRKFILMYIYKKILKSVIQASVFGKIESSIKYKVNTMLEYIILI
jgi:hypothetical protein